MCKSSLDKTLQKCMCFLFLFFKAESLEDCLPSMTLASWLELHTTVPYLKTLECPPRLQASVTSSNVKVRAYVIQNTILLLP